MALNTTYGRRAIPSLGAFVDLAHPLARGLLGAWLFNENSGPRAGDSAGLRYYHGTLSGGTWIGGSRASALLFNGSTDSVEVTSPADGSLSALPGISILGWIRPGVAQTGNILNKANNSEYRYRINNTRTITFLIGGSNQATTAGTAPGDVWTHVAVTYNAVGIALYLNGRLDATGGFAGGPTPGDSGQSLFFGTGAFGEIYSGALNEHYLYRRALSAAEILWHYEVPYALYPVSTARRWFFPPGSFTLTPASANLSIVGGAPTVLPVQIRPASGSLALTGAAPAVGLSGLLIAPTTGSLAFTGIAPLVAQTVRITSAVGSVTLQGLTPALERSDENMLGFQWPVLTAANIPLGFKWTVLPVVITGGELGFTWVVIAESATLGLTWHVVPAEIFELFESAGLGAAAGIGEDVLLPVGRVTRE
jgi:hypothetical protein